MALFSTHSSSNSIEIREEYDKKLEKIENIINEWTAHKNQDSGPPSEKIS